MLQHGGTVKTFCLSEKSQSQKTTDSMVPCPYFVQNRQTSGGSGGAEGGWGRGLTANGCGVSFWSDKNVLKLTARYLHNSVIILLKTTEMDTFNG